MSRKHWLCISTASLALMIVVTWLATPAFSYLSELTGSGAAAKPSHWDFQAFPVQWDINPATGNNISGSRDVATVIQAAFNTWLTAPNTTLLATRGADSPVTSESSSPSNVNLICFVCSDADFNKDSQTLAVTITTTADAAGQPDGHGGTSQFPGQIIKADIIFNTATQYSTDESGSGQDLQTVATHEIGHFFGLDHSGVVAAVMFPFAAPVKQTLSYDDVAGISTVYGNPVPDVATGSISGSVQMAGSSAGVLGAHVYAESTSSATPFASNIRKSPIGTLSLPGGKFTIKGVPPDSYIVVAEPLDGPVTNSDVPGFAPRFGSSAVQTNFTTRWH